MAAALVDTNVLVYAHDRGERAKQKRAVELLDLLAGPNKGCLSTQILAEFFQATTHGSRPILARAIACEQVEFFARSWPILVVTSPIVSAAVRAARDRKLSYFDAQLWATALLNQVPVIFSEDFASGSSIEGVRLVNPFDDSFVLADWA